MPMYVSIPGLRRADQPWYYSWMNAKRRCTDPKNNRYAYYGARGIKFELGFWEMGAIFNRDKANTLKHPQIHRINPQQGYTPGNCCFIEASEHNGITHGGKKRSIEACLNMSRASKRVRGEDHPGARLSELQVRRIFQETGRGSGSRLAKEFQVSRSTISAIRNRDNWGHLWLSAT